MPRLALAEGAKRVAVVGVVRSKCSPRPRRPGFIAITPTGALPNEQRSHDAVLGLQNAMTSEILPAAETMRADRRAAALAKGMAPGELRVALVCGDDAFRESLSLILPGYAIRVIPFASATVALHSLAAFACCQMVLVDLDLPDASGLLLLRRLRRSGIRLPVIVLSGPSEDGEGGRELHEKAALDGGADDFFDRSRSVTVLALRIKLVARRTGAQIGGKLPKDGLEGGPLALSLKNGRATWRGVVVPLSATEAKIVRFMAINAGEDISYRRIYDLVHGVNFVAGRGFDGYRANVRSIIRRIRRKLRGIDRDFHEIESFAGHGYRWRSARALPFDWPRQAVMKISPTKKSHHHHEFPLSTYEGSQLLPIA